MTKHLISLALLGLAVACATPPSAGDFALAGTSWQRNDDADANPHGATLEFSAARATGFTGCNTWFASFTQSGGALRFGSIGMTRMACPTGIQAATERNFMSALNQTRGYRLDGQELVLTGSEDAVVARFTCARDPCPSER